MKQREIKWNNLDENQNKNLIYNNQSKSTFFCKCCNKPVRYHSYCEEHWKRQGLEEIKAEHERMLQEKQNLGIRF